ncbi:serine O-acetyltransferase [Acinetobacter boissieri]|uniref:Serine acetyltransferase n=1 Tax=Acinetobacter boissieri TaxID=1219383 RepID=A0A1G6IYQ8_9GAMM|nr:serine O-acetyltransferase [Acinetobacter boissieri]SDC11205.1 serine O-acetyltransferase [Acinetobacter boissieri]
MIKQLKEDIAAVFSRDPAARNTLEVVVNYPGIHALVLHRVAHKMWQKNFKTSARTLASFSRFATGIEIHPGAKIGRRLFIDHGMGIVIGETAEIGDDVTLYHGVTLGGTTWKQGKRHPTLENGVIVGAGAKILGPFTVGKNAKIGSNTVILKSVPADTTAVGSPARYIIKNKQTSDTDQQREAYAKSIGFQAYAAAPHQSDPILEGINVLLDRLKHNEKQINQLNERLTKIDPKHIATIPQEQMTQEQLEILEKIRQVCNEQKYQPKT